MEIGMIHGAPASSFYFCFAIPKYLVAGFIGGSIAALLGWLAELG
jgi:hypothetical protein